MGVIHAVLPQEWRVLGLLFLNAVLDGKGLSGEAGGCGALVLTAVLRILLRPAPAAWGAREGRAGEPLMVRVVVGPPRWRRQRSGSRGEAVRSERWWVEDDGKRAR